MNTGISRVSAYDKGGMSNYLANMVFLSIVPGHLGNHLGKNKIIPLFYTIYKNKFQMG